MRIATIAAAPAALLAALMLALAGGAAADEVTPNRSGDKSGKYFWVNTATVVAVDPERSSLTVDEEEGRFTYRVDAATVIRKAGSTVELDAIEEGDRLAITGHEEDDVDDRPVADTIQVVVLDQDTGEPVRHGGAGGYSGASGSGGATKDAAR